MRSGCFYIAAYLAILLLPLSAASQTTKRLNYTSYNINEGLLNSQVYQAVEDGTGFIWFSSNSGVQRFDGRQFHKIPLAKNSNGLPDDTYVHFMRLLNGNLILSHRLGLSEYDISTNRFSTVLILPAENKEILPLCETANGIWTWIWGRGAFLVDPLKHCFSDSIIWTGTHEFSVPFKCLFNQDKLVLRLSAQLLGIMDLKTKTIREYKSDEFQLHFLDIENYGKDSILASAANGIYLFDMKQEKFSWICGYQTRKKFTNPLYPIKFLNTGEHTIVVSEGTGLFELDVRAKKYVSLLLGPRNDFFLNIGYVTDLLFDRYRNLWILTQNDGVRKINYGASRFRYYGTGKREANFVKTILINKSDNRVLCGTFENGIHVFDTTQQLLKSINSFAGSHPPNTVCSFLRLKPHQYLFFLMGSPQAYLLNTLTYEVSFIKTDIKNAPDFSPDYHMVLHPASDSLILSQSGYYVFKLSWENKNCVKVQQMPKMEFASVSSFLDKSNNLWVGSNGKYYRYSAPYNQYKIFDLAESVLIRCFTEDSSGLWMGSGRGMHLANKEGKILKSLYEEDGLVNDNIYGIRKDAEGHLWISHNKGISCRKKDGVWLHFNQQDGLQENEFNTNASFETEDGELFFAGVNGVTSFYPSQIESENTTNSILLAAVVVKDKPWKSDTAYWNIEKITLPYTDKNLLLDFTTLGSKNADQYNYQYRLKGHDAEWVNAGHSSMAHYVLEPGSYVLQYHAGTAFEKNPVQFRELQILIRPPFWKTTPFIALLVLLAVVTVILITRLISQRKLRKRIEELEYKRKLDEERLRISREMHDDIGAGLTQIALMSEAARQKKENEIQLNEISKTSRRLVNNMSEIIWSLNPGNNTLDLLLSYLREELLQLLEYSDITASIAFPPNGKEIELNNAQRRNILLITKEIVHNAVKHSRAHHISVVCEEKGDRLNFSITDDGIGFDPEHRRDGNGIRNINKRIHEMGGHVFFESSECGTCFTYEIPLKET